MAKATNKQMSFIELICAVCDLERPTELTKEQATKFIQDHIEEYETLSISYFYNWEDSDLL